MRRTNSLGPMRWCRISAPATSPPRQVGESWWSHPLLRREHDAERDPEAEHEPQPKMRRASAAVFGRWIRLTGRGLGKNHLCLSRVCSSTLKDSDAGAAL